jgi:E3 ubiquitin-protein ligase CCNP1IP1
MQIDQEHAQHKNHELAEAYREKSRKHLQIQELYDKLKRRTLYSQVQNAALETVDRTLCTPSCASKARDVGTGQQVPGETQNPLRHQRLPVDHQGVEQVHSRQRSGSASSGSPRHMAGNMAPPLNMAGNQGSGLWTSSNTRGPSPRKCNNPLEVPVAANTIAIELHLIGTPSQHRQRLPTPRHQAKSNPGSSNHQSNSFSSRASSSASNTRHTLGGLSLNPTSNFSGYGMRAGLRVGREQVYGLGGGREQG